MTELEKKAEKRCSELAENNCEYKTFWLDGYEQGQKDMPLTSEIIKEYLEIQKENKELKAQIEKMKCCDNCKHCHRQYEDIFCDFKNEYDDVICSRGYNGNVDGWELAE